MARELYVRQKNRPHAFFWIQLAHNWWKEGIIRTPEFKKH